MRIIFAALSVFAVLVMASSSPAEARPRHHKAYSVQHRAHHGHTRRVRVHKMQPRAHVWRRAAVHRVSNHRLHAGDPRPARWCGWFLRHKLGVADRRYNLARNWSQIGRPAGGPAPGVVAVWRHHVGIVTAIAGPGRIVLLSGNDGSAVRERERSARGVIAWRKV